MTSCCWSSQLSTVNTYFANFLAPHALGFFYIFPQPHLCYLSIELLCTGKLVQWTWNSILTLKLTMSFLPFWEVGFVVFDSSKIWFLSLSHTAHLWYFNLSRRTGSHAFACRSSVVFSRVICFFLFQIYIDVLPCLSITMHRYLPVTPSIFSAIHVDWPGTEVHHIPRQKLISI